MNFKEYLIEQERYPEDLESIVMRDQLFRAIENKDIKQVKELISAGANVNVRDETGWTPLHLAAYYGHKDVVKLLISAGADVNVENRNNRTALHMAISKGYENIISLLKKHGATY